MDSDGDGIGDLSGIISKLDYIKDLGFETIWISPFFASPQNDFGYDISDYYSIDPDYGNLTLVDSLIREVHSKDMKIIFDLVLNHTSIEHEWFQTSRSSKDNDRSDYYIWKDGNGKKPPNNWNNVFNKDAWHYDAERDQYYYTAFLDFQPDLNWRNEKVRAAMFDMVKFWLAKDADGFRLDIFNCIMEDPSFADNPFAFKMLPSRDGMKAKFQEKIHNINHPDNFTLARQLRDTIDRYSDPSRFLIGEAIGPLEDIHPLVGAKNDGLNLIFLFDMIYFDFKAKFFRQRIAEFETLFPSPLMPTTVYGNHDNFRRSRRLDNNLDKDRLITLFQLTNRGVPVVYYGAEIGMTNPKIPKKQALDPISKVFKGLPQFLRNILPVPVNRDVCRTPMQWSNIENGGFTGPNTQPWLPVNEDLAARNVADQWQDDRSLLNTYRDLLLIRKKHEVLQKGSIFLIDPHILPKNVLAFTRVFENEKWIVFLNFSKKKRDCDLSEILQPKEQLSTHSLEVIYQLRSKDVLIEKKVTLDKYGGLIIKLNSDQIAPLVK